MMIKPKIGEDGIPILEHLTSEHPETSNDDYSKKLGAIDMQEISNTVRHINNNISKELEILVHALKNSIADDLKKMLEELQGHKKNNSLAHRLKVLYRSIFKDAI